jgi:hypothetical protein
MILGVLNASAWSILYSGLDLNVELACQVYSALLAFFLLGIFIFDKDNYPVKIDITNKPNVIFSTLILLFPLLMFIESYFTLGYIPILSGVSIIDSMYTESYGKLYGYKSIMLFSIILSVYYSTYYKDDKNRALFFKFLTVLYMAISLFDGKRVIFICSLLCTFIYMNKVHGSEYIKKKAIYYIAIIFVIYTGISSLRSGGVSTDDVMTLDTFFYSVGVEFRDFIWTVTYYEPGEIPGYSWTLSSIGSFVNGSILSMLGVDKNSLVVMDSARSWMHLFDIDLGIRTGLFSELWFEFGGYSVLVSFIFGALISKLNSGIYKASSIKELMFRGFIYSFIFLAVMGQSSLFFGVLITCVYIFIIYNFIDYVMNKKINW